VSLQKQGANKGAVTAFLISTPESGVDSISVTYALLDPIMTIARPVASFFTALTAGIFENLFSWTHPSKAEAPDLRCPIDNCCDGLNCDPRIHANHHTLFEKAKAGFRFAFGELWEDMAGWFFFGLILAGGITALIPQEFLSRHLGGGLSAMFIMLMVGIPMYICATASTPIAAALILKGVSPGAVLVFLLAGPATNMASLTVLTKMIGKRATLIYLSSIAVCSVICGLIVDQVYSFFGLSAQGIIGKATELIPEMIEWMSTALLLYISIRPLLAKGLVFFKTAKEKRDSGNKTETGPKRITPKEVSDKSSCTCDNTT
jgi:hypothetical protein